MTDIAATLAGIKTVLTSNMDGVMVYDIARKTPVAPCIVCEFAGMASDSLGTSTLTTRIDLVALAGMADLATAQAQLFGYADLDSDTSIHAALKTDRTLNGTVSSCRIVEVGGLEEIQAGENVYLGLRFQLECL
jgi:hypothetical protein